MSHRLMSAKFKLCSTGLSVVLAATSLGLSSRDLGRRASWRVSRISESLLETIDSSAHNVGQASRLSCKRPGASDSVQPARPSEAVETPALRSGSCEVQGEDHE